MMSILIFIYNFLMLVGLILLGPILILLVGRRKKQGRPFFKRLYMESIDHQDPPGAADGSVRPIWIHALSVGEVLSAEPLVQALARHYGRQNLVFTASTHTGYKTAVQVIGPHVAALRHFPYDIPLAVHRSLAVIRPRLVVIVETDIWPNFLYYLKRSCIPALLVNARLSTRSFRGYKRVGFLMKRLLSVFEKIGVQTDSDRLRFRRLGVPGSKLVMAGNMKFDQMPAVLSDSERQQLLESFKVSSKIPVWVAGSTHEGEEVALCSAYRKVRADGLDLALLIAPRNPDRANYVAELFRNAGVDAVSLGQLERQAAQASVVVIDRIGILRKLYALCDVAFVGGSLVRAGGHNPLEPASVAKPILFGPHTDDFHWISQTLEKKGGAIRVFNEGQLAEQVSRLIFEKRKRVIMGQRAQEVFRTHQGAVDRTLTIVLTTDQNRCHGRFENDR